MLNVCRKPKDYTPLRDDSKKQFFDIIIFLVYARYVGRLFVKNVGKPVDILTRLNEMAGYAPEEDIELYEVCCLLSYNIKRHDWDNFLY